MKRIDKLAIANRGEVAVRIIRACRELGIQSVLLHSEADVKTLAYRLADERVCIGPAPVGESYLSISRNIEAAVAAKAQAIHPGFGFLSENADFAQACVDNKLIFVGPSPSAIRDMGDKVNAKALAKDLEIPVIPGYEGDDSNLDELKRHAQKIGFPIIVKAAGGGGGRGLKVARDMKELESTVEAAQREAAASFGSSRIFLEKYFEDAKHIEVQVFGDSQGHVEHLFERECSIQRRHQKMVEEAPSSNLNSEIRKELGEVAARLAQKVSYVGAGTVEFLYSKGKYYFMEMNTRLQVEHPVTELVTGLDLVKAQIQVARDEVFMINRDKIQPRGHSIECRLYAEDPHAQGRPSTGILGSVYLPPGPGRRFDFGFEGGDEITPYYDSMLGKLIVWDENRVRAIKRMRAVLDEVIVFGVKTNIPLLKSIFEHVDFISGKFNTQFMKINFDDGLEPEPLSDWQKKIEEELRTQSPTSVSSKTEAPSPWALGWRA
jgi:acetyl-CoA carboxylase biotin carboxylase subunit